MNTNATIYTVKSVKTFRGREGQGFNATLLCNGKPVAHVDDDANGGCYDFHWLNKDRAQAQADEDAFNAYVKTLPPMEYMGDELIIDGDLFVSELVEEISLRKQMDRLLKTCVVLIEGGKMRNTKRGAQPTPALIEAVKKAHPTATILNEMDAEAAFAAFKTAA
jgi:hypothetical protein